MEKEKSLQLRRYPWPYSAALTISNDCDYLTFDAALPLMRFLNVPTSEGGLGLDVSDSFFFFQNGSLFSNSSYFENITNNPSPVAPAMRELIRTGHLDTTHALGDFENGNFKRRHAQWCAEELEKHGLRIPIFTNHGGFSNRQNVGRVENCYYHAGDDLHSPFYHLDIMHEMGVRYVWTDTSKTKWIDSDPVGDLASESERVPPRSIPASSEKPLWEDYSPSWNYDQRKVFERIQTRSGAFLQGFIRYDGFFPDGDCGLDMNSLLTSQGRRAGPNIGRLAVTLRRDLLDTLVEKEGSCIYYQHLAILGHNPERSFISPNLEFHPDNLTALRLLKEYQDEGKIWVPSLATFLDYAYMLNSIQLTADPSSSETHWELTASVTGDFDYRGIEGLCIDVPESVEMVRIKDPYGIVHDLKIESQKNSHVACLPVRRLPQVDWHEIAALASISLSEQISVELLDGTNPVSLDVPRPVVSTGLHLSRLAGAMKRMLGV